MSPAPSAPTNAAPTCTSDVRPREPAGRHRSRDWAPDYLAHGAKNVTGNGSYTVSADDGSVTVDITIT